MNRPIQPKYRNISQVPAFTSPCFERSLPYVQQEKWVLDTARQAMQDGNGSRTYLEIPADQRVEEFSIRQLGTERKFNCIPNSSLWIKREAAVCILPKGRSASDVYWIYKGTLQYVKGKDIATGKPSIATFDSIYYMKDGILHDISLIEYVGEDSMNLQWKQLVSINGKVTVIARYMSEDTTSVDKAVVKLDGEDLRVFLKQEISSHNDILQSVLMNVAELNERDKNALRKNMNLLNDAFSSRRK